MLRSARDILIKVKRDRSGTLVASGRKKGSNALQYFPIPPWLLAALGAALALLATLIILNALAYGYGRMGIPRVAALALLLASLLGSYVNLPLVTFPEVRVVVLPLTAPPGAGTFYAVPEVRTWPGMVLALNVGGALIPAVVSAYIIVRSRLLVPAFFCAAFVAAVVHFLAHPVPGVGIVVPIYAPPLAAVLAALLASPAKAAALAYAGGSVGTLVGGDLMNLRELLDSGAPLVSIGGAGLFDGIFLAGVLALLLACLATERLSGKR
jgi:uncharacterized membrane protein